MILAHYVSKDGKEHTVNFGQHSEYIVILDGETAEDELLTGFQVDSETEFEPSRTASLPTNRILTP